MIDNKIIKKANKYKRNFNWRLVKKHCSYSVQEMADLFNIHTNTVLSWIEAGLEKIDAKKPFLIFGADLICFLKDKKRQKKTKTNADQLFCFKCKTAQHPSGNSVRIKIMDAKRLMINGACEQCNHEMSQIGTCKRLEEYEKIFTVQQIQNEHLLVCSPGNGNSD